ncbi:MAG: FHA domain-containing protein [Chloroflexi bacterium]|nr:FHA domain-containing protein [Chloroflexota bacterium]
MSALDGLDAFALSLWLLRIAFLAGLYLFLLGVGRMLLRDLRVASATTPGELGRLVVVGSFEGGPPVGASFPLDAVTTVGRDVNNTIAVDDPFVSTDHAVLTFRGRGWYLEDLQSTNGTYLNGAPVIGVAPLGFGDEVQIGQLRVRLDRPRPVRAA